MFLTKKKKKIPDTKKQNFPIILKRPNNISTIFIKKIKLKTLAPKILQVKVL